MKNVYLALGSNLGDRAANLQRAKDSLNAAGVRVLRESAVYETEPRDLPDQPWFLNQVLEVDTSFFPRQLLSKVKKIERDLGRRRTVAKGPRVIDIDILLFRSALVSTADLEIPHLRLAERRFVLEPLAELAPDLRHPRTNRTVREMLARISDEHAAGQAVRRFRMNEPRSDPRGPDRPDGS